MNKSKKSFEDETNELKVSKVKKGQKTIVVSTESNDDVYKPKKGQKDNLDENDSPIEVEETKVKKNNLKGLKKTSKEKQSKKQKESDNEKEVTEIKVKKNLKKEESDNEEDEVTEIKVKKVKKKNEVKKKTCNLMELIDLFMINLINKLDESDLIICVENFINELNADQIVEIYSPNKIEHEQSTNKTKIQVSIGNALLERFLPNKLELFLDTEDKEICSALVEHFLIELTSGLEKYKNCDKENPLYEYQQANWQKYRKCEWKCQLVKDKSAKDKAIKKTNQSLIDNTKVSKKNVKKK